MQVSSVSSEYVTLYYAQVKMIYSFQLSVVVKLRQMGVSQQAHFK